MPKLFLRISFLIPVILLIFADTLTAGNPPDSLKWIRRKDSTIVLYFHNDFEKFGNLDLKSNDTTITGFQNYDPGTKHSRFYATTGNIGQSQLTLVPYPFIVSTGFDYGIHTFDRYLLKNDSIKYFKIYKIFTEFEYVQGAKKELFFHGIFSRNIYRSLNLGVEFRAMNAPGAYLRQRTNQFNFVVTAQFFTKNKRYGVIANMVYNLLRMNENGGIKSDSLFEQNIETNRQIIPINLDNAQNRIHDFGFYMKHYFNISRHPKNEKDTAFFAGKHFDLGRITYSFEYNKSVQNYIDNNPKQGFYRNIFIDSTLTFDSVIQTRYINQLSWSNPSFNVGKNYRVLQLEAGIKFQYIILSFYNYRRYFNQKIPYAEMLFHPFTSLTLRAYGDYAFGDYNQNDLSLKVALSQTLGSQKNNVGTITARGLYAFQKPGLFYETWQGNHFRWDTSWVKQNIISGSFSYNLKNIVDAGVCISRINHFVYLDSSVQPRQLTKEFGYFYTYLNCDVDLWKFKFKGQFAYQTVQGTNSLELPAFIGNLTIYFTKDLFHGTSTFQPGLNFFYNTLYYANAYMPDLRSFYLQNNRQTGNYLYMDVFINLKIQRARIFVMYSHFNASFMGRTYYMVPGYPMQDAAFKFGVTWRFHD